MIKYLKHENPEYYEVIVEGEIDLNGLLDIIKHLGSNIEANNIKLLQNYSNAAFKLNPDEMVLLTNTTHDYLSYFDRVKTASLVSDSNVTALNMLYGASIQDPRFNQQAFSTRSAALFWLLD